MPSAANQCDCLDFFYDNNVALCVACHPSCKTCSGPAFNQCLSCPSSSNRVSTPSSFQCPCLANFYDNNVTVCVACNPSCKTCNGTNSNQCLTCPTGANRIASVDASNSCPCNTGFYDSGVQICSACHNSCLTCNGPSSSQCLTCPTSSNRATVINASNQCPCLVNFYDNATNIKVCLNCHPSCNTCTGSGSNQCLTCPPASNRSSVVNGSNQCLCSTGFY